MNPDPLSNKMSPVFNLNIRKFLKRQNLSFSCLLFCLFLSVLLNPLLSQQLKPDSLLSLLKTSKADTNRVNIYYHLSDFFSDSDPQKSIVFARDGLNLSEKIGFMRGKSLCINAIGLAFYQMGEFDSSLYYFEKRFKIVSDLNDKLGLATTYDNLGVIAIHFGKIDTALALRKRANEIYISLNKLDLLAGGYNWIGNIYKEQGDYPLALEYYLKSLKIFEDEKDYGKIGYPLLNISSIYRYMKEYEKAKTYALDAKSRFSELKNDNAVGVSLYRLSIVYSEEEDYDNAIKNLLEAKTIFEKVKNNYFLTSVNSLLGTCYMSAGDSDKALPIFVNALAMARSIGDLSLISSINRNLSTIYIGKGSYQKALYYLQRADSISNILKDNNALVENSVDFIEIFSHSNKPDSILKYFHRFHDLSDTIYSEKNMKAIAGMQSKYESDKKDQLLQFQKNSLKNKNLIILISGSGAGLILFALILIAFLYKSKDRAYKRLVYQNLVSAGEKKIDMVDNLIIERPVEIIVNGKHNNMVLDDEHKKQILDCIKESLKMKAFTDPDLSILMLAERCGTNRSYMSAVINETYRMNYSTFINKLRIDEAIMYLSDSNVSVPLKELYQKLGFHSYSVFNESFKKFVGVTPAYFQKTARKMKNKSKEVAAA
jgi:tetratricopeptide (TPR) repeat protein